MGSWRRWIRVVIGCGFAVACSGAERAVPVSAPSESLPVAPARSAVVPATAPHGPIAPAGSPVLIGVGDRVRIAREGVLLDTADEALRLGLSPDFLALWLPRGWQPAWVDPVALRTLSDRGITPLVFHYFFGSGVSRERVESARDAWLADVARLAERIATGAPVWVALEPEWNDDPPAGETPLRAWAGFAGLLAEAVAILRRVGPQVRVGVSVGDFSPERDLATVLGPLAPQLDFIAFSEMRAATAPDARDRDAAGVGAAALAYATYLARAFDRPLLLGYLAVSSYGNWTVQQSEALAGLRGALPALRDVGVFGIGCFQLVDDPAHVGYFGAAEPHFGLVTAAGVPKPGFAALLALREAAQRTRAGAPTASPAASPRPHPPAGP